MFRRHAFAATAVLAVFCGIVPATCADGPATAPERTCRLVLNVKYEGLPLAKAPPGVAKLAEQLIRLAGYRVAQADVREADATLTFDLDGKLKSKRYDEYEDTGEDHLFVQVTLAGMGAFTREHRETSSTLSGGCLIHSKTTDEHGLVANAYEHAFIDTGLPRRLAELMFADDPEQVVFLANVLKSGDHRLVPSAADGLKEARDPRPALPALIAAYNQTGSGNVVAIMVKIGGDEVVDCFLAAMSKQQSKESAIRALANFPEPRVIDALVAALLADRNSYVLEQSIATVGQPAAARLIEVLKQPNPAHQAVAASMLARIKSKSAVEPLIRLLASDDKDVRWQAVRALGEIGDARAKQPLIKLVNDDKEVRPAALFALGKLKAWEAMDLLLAGLKDNDSRTRDFAVWGLEAISGEKLGNELAPWQAWWQKTKAATAPN